jgi:hypothetical protein
VRRFPFGHEPVIARVPEEVKSRTTEPLVGFAASGQSLPFRPPPPASVATTVVLPRPVLPPLRRRRAVRAWILVALAVMVVLDAMLLGLVGSGLR